MKIDASEIKKILKKLKHKDPALFKALQKKIAWLSKLDRTITEKYFKNLQYELSDSKRIQIGSFVLFFKVEGDTIILNKFVHHDKAYKR